MGGAASLAASPFSMARERRCDKCGSMASATKDKKRMTVICPRCKHKTVKNIVKKGRGG